MLDTTSHPFEALTPDYLIDAIESSGYRCDGRIFPLNSYENRVYQVGIEEHQPIIAKFYRPGRWNKAQIDEEHQFCLELEAQELPIVTPIKNDNGETINQYGEFYFSLFPRRGGHSPELDNLDHLYSLGKLMGRIHATGAIKPFQHRSSLTLEEYGYNAVSFILDRFIPQELARSYSTLTEQLLAELSRQWPKNIAESYIRCHGDCHIGNILWRDEYFHFVDFDDCKMAPAIQDIWLLLSGEKHQQQKQLLEILEGYEEFFEFDISQLKLIEPLRTLRIINHTAWIARRWDDPAFPHTFNWFNTPRYWGEHILSLREQLANLYEPPLQIHYP